MPWAQQQHQMNHTLSLKSFKVRSVKVHPAMAAPCRDKRRTIRFFAIKNSNKATPEAQSTPIQQDG